MDGRGSRLQCASKPHGSWCSSPVSVQRKSPAEVNSSTASVTRTYSRCACVRVSPTNTGRLASAVSLGARHSCSDARITRRSPRIALNASCSMPASCGVASSSPLAMPVHRSIGTRLKVGLAPTSCASSAKPEVAGPAFKLIEQTRCPVPGHGVKMQCMPSFEERRRHA